jgi:hypothetical protein
MKHIVIRYVKDDYRKITQQCPKCHTATGLYYTSDRLEQWKKNLTLLRGLSYLSSENFMKYKEAENKYRIEFKEVQLRFKGE